MRGVIVDNVENQAVGYMGHGSFVPGLDGKEIMEMPVGLRQAVRVNAVKILQCHFRVVGNYGGDARKPCVGTARAAC